MSLASRLASIPGLRIERDASLSDYTRFGLGGPASLLADAPFEDAFLAAWRLIKSADCPLVVIGGGSNLVAADSGYRGVVLRYTGSRMEIEGTTVSAVLAAVKLPVSFLTAPSSPARSRSPLLSPVSSCPAPACWPRRWSTCRSCTRTCWPASGRQPG